MYVIGGAFNLFSSTVLVELKFCTLLTDEVDETSCIICVPMAGEDAGVFRAATRAAVIIVENIRTAIPVIPKVHSYNTMM